MILLPVCLQVVSRMRQAFGNLVRVQGCTSCQFGGSCMVAITLARHAQGVPTYCIYRKNEYNMGAAQGAVLTRDSAGDWWLTCGFDDPPQRFDATCTPSSSLQCQMRMQDIEPLARQMHALLAPDNT